MTSPSGTNPPYQVICSQEVAEATKQLQRHAAQLGMGDQVLLALKTIQQRLENDPLGFGEPLYHLHALQLCVSVGIARPLVVEFAVHEGQPLVFIRVIRAMPGHGL